MSILDKVHDDVGLLADRANNKIEQLELTVSKLLLPGFKQIESDLKKLGVSTRNLDFDVSGLRFHESGGLNLDFITNPFFPSDMHIYSEGIYIGYSCSSADALQSLDNGLHNLPDLFDFLGDSFSVDSGTLELDESSIVHFESFMDTVISFVTSNSNVIISTLESAIIYFLKDLGKL